MSTFRLSPRQTTRRTAEIDMHSCPIVTGFDGFVDEIVTLVGERRTLDNFTSVPDIATFGTLISAAAGHNSLRDIVVKDVHPDGCAVNHFEPAGPVTLGLNGNEANILCRLHDMPYFEPDTSAEVVLQQAFTLREQLGVAEKLQRGRVAGSRLCGFRLFRAHLPQRKLSGIKRILGPTGGWFTRCH